MTHGDAAEIFSHPASDFAAKLERFSPGVTEIAASTFVEGDLRLVPSFGEACGRHLMSPRTPVVGSAMSPPTPFRLDGKTAVVTGGTKGLGCVRAAVHSALVAPLTRCAVASHRAVARHSSATSLSSSPLRYPLRHPP
jgi:hypothetical protein